MRKKNTVTPGGAPARARTKEAKTVAGLHPTQMSESPRLPRGPLTASLKRRISSGSLSFHSAYRPKGQVSKIGVSVKVFGVSLKSLPEAFWVSPVESSQNR